MTATRRRIDKLEDRVHSAELKRDLEKGYLEDHQRRIAALERRPFAAPEPDAALEALKRIGAIVGERLDALGGGMYSTRSPEPGFSEAQFIGKMIAKELRTLEGPRRGDVLPDGTVVE